MTLPALFQGAIAAWLETNAKGSLRRDSAALTATYRAGGHSADIDLASYLVVRLPATYAAVSQVMAEAAARRPGFAPTSLLDAGSGPGTASWAAAEVWPGLEKITFLDNTPALLKLAGALAVEGPQPIRHATAVEGSIETVPPSAGADVVVAAYALAEIPLARIRAAVERLWAASRSMLVIVEPGTPAGFARVRAARDALLAQGAWPVAPCTHADSCPMSGAGWCHFSVRLARSRAHMHAKAASVPFEDERYSYIVLSREAGPLGYARIIAPPVHAKPGATFTICSEGVLQTHHVARRDGPAYKQIRKLAWGDLLGPANMKEERP
jgi:ribosomal protein RSM22 (predicted rRNA methylase)